MITAIFYIVLGIVMWQVFPGMIGRGSGTDAVKSVLKILGIILLIVGIFRLIMYIL